MSPGRGRRSEARARRPRRGQGRAARPSRRSSDALVTVPTAPGTPLRRRPGGSLPGSPYPDMLRPTPEECWAARDAGSRSSTAAFFQHKEAARWMALGREGPRERSQLDLPRAPHGRRRPRPRGARPDPVHDPPRRFPRPRPPTVRLLRSRAKSVLDSFVGTILSQNTTDATSAVAFANLKHRFPTWELRASRGPEEGGGGGEVRRAGRDQGGPHPAPSWTPSSRSAASLRAPNTCATRPTTT